MNFEIEYEIPPLRAIYYAEVKADTKEKAKEKFLLSHPMAKIRKIEAANE